MTELILKQDIDENKMKTLIDFLKSWGIDEFSLSAGLWADYQINGAELRNEAWSRNK